MNHHEQTEIKIPVLERLKGIPNVFGIRLEEEPEYKVLRKDGAMELREYSPTLLASTNVYGHQELASEEGFKRLAQFIFGQNDQEEKIEMTAPVFKELLTDEAGVQSWVISFVMSSRYLLGNVPRPVNDRIHLRELPQRNTLVYEYSGKNYDDEKLTYEEELKNWISECGYRAVSGTKWAQHDPPFSIPAFRRNEIQIDVLV